MCTISTIPLKDEFVITFNRDEREFRQSNDFISIENTGGKKIIYAKDPLAGGSWFAVDSQGNAAVLFNGGFKAHRKLPQYRISRGKLLLLCISAKNPLHFLQEIELSGIEPFSVLLYTKRKLRRITWTGNGKYFTELQHDKMHIFSSCTIYHEEIQKMRREWLQNYFQTSPIHPDTIINFHTSHNADDPENGLVIDRRDGCKTISISQMVLGHEGVKILHINTITGKKSTAKLDFL